MGNAGTAYRMRVGLIICGPRNAVNTKRQSSSRINSECFRLYAEGYSYRAIAYLLADLGMFTAKSSEECFIRSSPPHRGRRTGVSGHLPRYTCVSCSLRPP